MIKLMLRILKISKEYKGRILLAFVFSFLKSMLSKTPVFLGFIACNAFYNGTMDIDLCINLALAMTASVLFQALFQYSSDRLQSAAGYMIFSDMRMELGAHLRKMPMGYFTEGNIGKISSVLSTDMVFIEENCMTALADMMSYVFAEIIMVMFMFYLHVWLGFAAAVLAAGIYCVGKASEQEALRDSGIRQEQSEKLTDAVLDFVEGISIIKTYNLLGEKSKELRDNFCRSCEFNLAFEKNHKPWQRRLQIAYGIGSAAVLAAACYLSFRGQLSVPGLIGVVLFIFDLFNPIKLLYSQGTRLTVMSSCMDRIEEVFHEPELPDFGTGCIPSFSSGAEISFHDVSFAYKEKNVLHKISFEMKRNEMTALVGPSGGGKSTIANLLTRFWDMQEGMILIRGVDIRKVPLINLMEHISMVFQRVYLFQDTIYNNICMGNLNASEEDVIEAARKARCYDFIKALPDGFQTIVGEGGASLSGGEQQRISIARCILKDAPIVILDEATASVDADNESYIQEAISELCKGKTLLVIAHRLNTIKNADKILVISDGQIAESGTHRELMEHGGIYRRFITARENAKGWNRRKSSAADCIHS